MLRELLNDCCCADCRAERQRSRSRWRSQGQVLSATWSDGTCVAVPVWCWTTPDERFQRSICDSFRPTAKHFQRNV